MIYLFFCVIIFVVGFMKKILLALVLIISVLLFPSCLRNRGVNGEGERKTDRERTGVFGMNGDSDNASDGTLERGKVSPRERDIASVVKEKIERSLQNVRESQKNGGNGKGDKKKSETVSEEQIAFEKFLLGEP